MVPDGIRGMLDLASLQDLIAEEKIETIVTVFPDIYGRLIGKRITGDFFLNDVVGKSVHACDYLLACDIELGQGLW